MMWPRVSHTVATYVWFAIATMIIGTVVFGLISLTTYLMGVKP